jgi:hypothetical protein
MMPVDYVLRGWVGEYVLRGWVGEYVLRGWVGGKGPVVEYIQGAESPTLTASIRSADTGALLDLTTGYTFELKLGTPGEDAVLTKTTGITATSEEENHNIEIVWGLDELDIAPGRYTAQLRVNRTADDVDIIIAGTLVVVAAIT